MIVSRRLELVSLSPEFVEALLDGRRDEAGRIVGIAIPEDWPDDHDARFLGFRARQMLEGKHEQRWLVYAIALRDANRRMLGHIGFHGNPGTNAKRAEGAVELGYTVFEEHRRQGYATEAIQALMGWAREHEIHHFILSIGPDNGPSLAIARKLGFVETGRHWDEEDGDELEFELNV